MESICKRLSAFNLNSAHSSLSMKNMTLSMCSSTPKGKFLVFDNSVRLLCVGFHGRLGNELFEYASTLGLALTLNRTPVFLDSNYLPEVLKTFITHSTDDSMLRLRCRCAKLSYEPACCRFAEKLTRLDPKYDYRIERYLQSHRYFSGHETCVREAMAFSDVIQIEAASVVKGLRKQYNSSVLVAIHVRRGDMGNDYSRSKGYPMVTSAYLQRAAAYFRKLYPRCVFVVACLDKRWVQGVFSNLSHVHFLKLREPAVDMWTLSSLDHTVISVGTYSWWVGFYSRGSVVYMKDFVFPNTTVGNQFRSGRQGLHIPWVDSALNCLFWHRIMMVIDRNKQ